MLVASEGETPKEASLLKGLTAGLVGGFVASFAMDKFQALWFRVAERMEEPRVNNSLAQDGQQSQDGVSFHDQEEKQEPATIKAAEAISERVFGHKLSQQVKPLAGNAVHYAVGGTTGAIYGVVAEVESAVTIGAGLPFGTVFWLVVDEGAVPALGLSKPATEYPLSTHAYALASHLVFGLTNEIVRRVLRRTILL
jgi:putative membrane protein